MTTPPRPTALASEKRKHPSLNPRYTDGWRARLKLSAACSWAKHSTIKDGDAFDQGWRDADLRRRADIKHAILMARRIFVGKRPA